MVNSLQKAIGLVESVRYSGDTLKVEESAIHRDNDRVDFYFSLNSILINPLVTPEISNSVDKVVDRLNIPKKSIKAYVYASSDIQAECHAGNDNDCIIRLSSGLIDILEYAEIEFVIGHEIGHFLFSHGLALSTPGNESLELSIQKRAQEISADRVGLLASESLDVSIRALMKTMSGLSSKYLKFDIGAFLSQLSNSESFKSQMDVNSSHPSMLVRCRALLWFSMCDTFKSGSHNYQANEVNGLNEKIRSDIDKFVDAASRKKIKTLKQDLALWMSALSIVKNGSFSKDEQRQFSEMFDSNILDKLKGFLSGLDASTASKTIEQNLEKAKNELYNEIPTSFNKELNEISQEVRLRFN